MLEVALLNVFVVPYVNYVVCCGRYLTAHHTVENFTQKESY